MNTLLLAVALLCGVPIGLIIGLVLGVKMVRARWKRDDDLDYSGGV